jgi:hypothetical protein
MGYPLRAYGADERIIHIDEYNWYVQICQPPILIKAYTFGQYSRQLVILGKPVFQALHL